MKKDTIKKIIKIIQIFIITNTLCIATALSFYIFLAFVFRLLEIPGNIQNFIFIFCFALLILITGFLNALVFYDEFENKENLNDD